MPVTIQAQGNRLVIEGDMTIYTAAELKPTLLDHVQVQQESEIDLSQVAEIDTAGVQLLLLAKREATDAGRALRLTGHSPAVLSVLDLFNLAAHFGDPLVLAPQ